MHKNSPNVHKTNDLCKFFKHLFIIKKKLMKQPQKRISSAFNSFISKGYHATWPLPATA